MNMLHASEMLESPAEGPGRQVAERRSVLRRLLPKMSACIALACYASSPFQSAAQPPPAKLEMFGGLPVRVSLENPISSSNAKAGDVFAIRASEDVVAQGYVLVRKGAQGQEEIVAADGAGGNGHPGSLTLKYDWIYAADGLKVRLSSIPQGSTGVTRKARHRLLPILTYFTPVGLFAHNWIRGNNDD